MRPLETERLERPGSVGPRNDVLMLFDDSLDGIDDPESAANQWAVIGDMRPQAWFEPFNNVEPRDPTRGFRR